MEISFDRSEVLGRGGYGKVFKGFWRDRPVAVKRIVLTSDEQEEKSLRELDHENVIKLFHVESDENFRYYVLELCEASLDKLFLRYGDPKIYLGPIPSPEDVLIQMARGLAYIHEQELAHRDVKPENVLISSTNDVALMKWADFGLSKAVNKKGNFTTSGVQGTKKWLAPELMESSSETTLSRYQRSTVKSDVFAEGSVFAYFLSDGKHPFGTKRSEISVNVLKNNPVNLTSIPSLQAQELIGKMLAKNPEDRINSSDVVKELEKINDQLKKDLKTVDSMIPSVNQMEKKLGLGGFGIVWVGVWRKQKVAVKRMEIRDDRKLFHEREENLLKFNHPNVVKMFHIESDSAFKYYALELGEASLEKLFLEGDELKNYKGPRLQDMPQPKVVFSQLAKGMAYIHKMGIAHRDVKPANVLFYVRYKNQESQSDQKQIEQVIFKWADFGASKKVDRLTGDCSTTGWKFTLIWCAPEVLKIYANESSPSAGIKSDVFSEGLIFSCYLLEGKHPYGDLKDVLGTANNLRKNEPQKLNEIPTEHQKLKELIEKMLKTDPTERPSSEEVAEKLASLNKSRPTALDAASSSSSSSRKTRTIIIDRRKILGRGAFGMVFKGNYGSVGPVAVKRIQLDYSNDREESQMILNHQNNTCQYLVKLYHVENDEDFKYFALELCSASLDQLFLHGNKSQAYNGRKPYFFEVMYQLAFGLEYIHSKDIVYRDIKPENVLISVDTTSTKITMKWADFGFSKSKGEQGSVSFSGSGVNQTSNWLAPELLNQSHYEERTKGYTKMSDIFAEGLLFCFFLLEGRHPYGSSSFKIPDNILRNDKVNFTMIESSCYRDIILKMLEPNPEDRITSSELAAFVQLKQEALEVRLLALLEETPSNLNEIENVICEGININGVNKNYGLTPLLRLIQKEKGDLLQVIPLLLQHGIDVNHKDEDGWSVLFFLCRHYQEENLIKIIRLLIEHGIDVSCKDKDGKNVLHLLCKYYQKDNLIEIIRLLIEHGIDVSCKDKDGKNVLHLICKKYQKGNLVEIIRLLIARNLGDNLKNKDNILHFYCKKYKGRNFIDIVNIFLENGVEVVSEGVDARHLVCNPKYHTWPNAEKITELMNTKCKTQNFSI